MNQNLHILRKSTKTDQKGRKMVVYLSVMGALALMLVFTMFLADNALKTAREALETAKKDPATNRALSERLTAQYERAEHALELARTAQALGEIASDEMKKHRNSTNGSLGAQTKRMDIIESVVAQLVAPKVESNAGGDGQSGPYPQGEMFNGLR